MRCRPNLSAPSLVGILLVVGACTDSTEPDLQLTVSLTVSSTTVSAERPVTITVTATNQSGGPVEVLASSCPEAYRVTTTSGTVVAPGPALCAAIAHIRVLQPGEKLEFVYAWAGTTRQSVSGSAVELPTGSYHLRGTATTRGKEFTSEAVPILLQ